MPNAIHNIDTKIFRNETGEFPAVVMGLNIDDEGAFEAFLDHVVDQFKNQRMCSPPQTANMVITLTGSVTAARFCKLWTARVDKDPVLLHFMSLMAVANVLHIRGRELLDQASLVRP
jgi:hypothetical protein